MLGILIIIIKIIDYLLILKVFQSTKVIKMSNNDRLENVNPHVFSKVAERSETSTDWDDEIYDPFDSREVFDLIRNIRDPEHPLSLEELNVVNIVPFFI